MSSTHVCYTGHKLKLFSGFLDTEICMGNLITKLWWTKLKYWFTLLLGRLLTGKHQWIFSDEHKHVANSLSSSELCHKKIRHCWQEVSYHIHEVIFSIEINQNFLVRAKHSKAGGSSTHNELDDLSPSNNSLVLIIVVEDINRLARCNFWLLVFIIIFLPSKIGEYGFLCSSYNQIDLDTNFCLYN